jgi:hypothetical protein
MPISQQNNSIIQYEKPLLKYNIKILPLNNGNNAVMGKY